MGICIDDNAKIDYDHSVIAHRSKHLIWTVPLLAAVAVLCVLELTFHFSPRFAVGLALLALLVVLIRLIAIALKQP